MFDAALLPSVLASAPDAIVVVDESGEVLYANHRLTALFGYLPDELIGKPIELLLPEKVRHVHVAHRQGFHRTLLPRPMGVGRELFARRKDGSEVPVEISLSPIGETGSLVAAAIRDATERKAAESALRLARAEAERANLAKSRFLAAASHDLRQPLQALAFLNGTLRRTVSDPELLDTIQQQGQAISTATRLLGALLDISKLESGAVVVETTDFDLGNVLEELRDEFKVVATEKGLDLQVDLVRARARTDRTLVMQALRNLVANALKYTDRGSVTLTCREEAPSVWVEVADTGIGIDSRNINNIFEEFFQIGAKTHTSRPGYGLGLSIVQRIARLLGIDVGVRSVPGHGSTFRLTLPAGAGSGQDLSETGRQRLLATPRTAGHIILLVEDDPAVRKATQVFLRSEGHRVLAASSLEEAIRLGQENEVIDLVVSDYHLEESRGTAVISALRERHGDHLPSILMTGDTSSAVKELPRDSQLRVISKPVDADELLDLIRVLLPAVGP